MMRYTTTQETTTRDVGSLTLYDIASHKSSGVLIALYAARGQILLHLQTEQVPSELLLQSGWV